MVCFVFPRPRNLICSAELKIGSGFAYIALWQLLVFGMLVLLVWVNEMLDLPALMFGISGRSADVTRGCLATAGVLVAAVCTVGNTYLQQRQIVKGLLTICSYCKKIRIESSAWQQVEEYIGKRSPIQFTHSVCPDCFVRVNAMITRDDDSDSGRPGRTRV